MLDLQQELELMNGTKLTTVRYSVAFATEIISRAIYAEAKVDNLRERLEDLIRLCENCGSFKNGVSALGMDEGETKAWEIIDKIKKEVGVENRD